MAANVRVTVYRPQIASLFGSGPGGEVRDEAVKITTEVKARAIVRSSKFSRSGEIVSSHHRRVIRSGTYGVKGYVENTSDHALYKHNGTIGPIEPHTVAEFRLPPWGRYGWTRAAAVSGQKGNPWLRRAANDVLSRYGVRVTDADVSFG